MMKIVIDIPESIIDTIEDDSVLSREQVLILMRHIQNGKPLPKGHGRLIDADDFILYLNESMNETKYLFATEKHRKLAEQITSEFCKDIEEAKTVVEADKEADDGRSDERP